MHCSVVHFQIMNFTSMMQIPSQSDDYEAWIEFTHTIVEKFVADLPNATAVSLDVTNTAALRESEDDSSGEIVASHD